MNDVQKCPQCGADLPADAPAGICPKCLLGIGMASDTNVRGEDSANAPTTPLPSSSRFTPPAPETLARLFPQLQILGMIGAGGMGAVYKARQPGLDRLVAIKILPPEVGADPAFAQRFTREAQALARLGHQHIVSVYDFGVAEGLYYFIMEYVDGANLRHLIKTGELKPTEALAIVPQICEALQFAHDEGVVHRDIKPENILIDKRGRVKIADFGLARLLGNAAPEMSLTGTNQVLGTLHYMAPEQIQGLRSVDHRADIYSLGVVFYEMLTGELPIGRFAPPSQKVEIDVRLDEVVLRSLESKPERRYQHASEVKTEVERISVDSASDRADREVSRHDRSISAQPPAAVNVSPAIAFAERSTQKLATAMLIVGGLGLALVLFFLPAWLFFGGAEGVFRSRAAANRSHQGDTFHTNFLFLSMLYGFVAIPQALFIIVAALFLRNQRGYWLAIAACVVAALPITLVFPVGLPVALWGLAVLTSSDVRALFARTAAADARSPSQRVLWPVVLLLAASIIDAVLMVVYIGASVETFQRGSKDFSFVLALAAVTTLMFVTRLVAAIQLFRLRSLRLCKWASIISLLPASFGSIIGVPAAIWALVELAQAGVKKAFENKAGGQNDASHPITPVGLERARQTEQPELAGSPNIADQAVPIKAAEASVDEEEERQRAAELAERAPAWLAFVEMAIFAAGWLLAGAMWNFGSIGLWIAFVVLAALTYMVIGWNLRYLPKLRGELARQSRLRRGFALVAALAIFLFAMIFVTSTQTGIWSFMGDPSSFSFEPKQEREELLAALKRAKLNDGDDKNFNMQLLGPFTIRSPWEPLVMAFCGFCIIVGAVSTAIDTRRFRNTWKHSWRPSLSVATLLFTMFVVLQPFFLPKGTGRVPARNIRGAATSTQLKSIIETWAHENGYTLNVVSGGGSQGGGSQLMPLKPVDNLKPEDLGQKAPGKGELSVSKDGTNYIIKDGKVFQQVYENFKEKSDVERYRLSRPTMFDLFHTSLHGVYRPHPPLVITCVTKTSTRNEQTGLKKGPETTTIDAFAEIQPPWDWLGTPEMKLWTPLLDELETKFRIAADASSKPSEQ